MTTPCSAAPPQQKPDGISTVVQTVLDAKAKLIEAARANDSAETGRQLALLLRTIETNSAVKAALAVPTELKPPRSKSLSGFSSVQSNPLLREAWLKIRDALYGAEAVARVTSAFERLRASGREFQPVARKIRQEFEADGKLREMEKMWRNLEGCFVHQIKQANGQEAWVWSAVNPLQFEAVFGPEK